MPKKLTDQTTKRKAKISGAKHSALVKPTRRPRTIAETAKLSDMYRPIPGFFKDARLALGMSNERFAEAMRMDPGAASRLGHLRGLQLAQACWASDALGMPLEDIAEGMGVVGWTKRAIGATQVPLVATIDADLVVHRFRADRIGRVDAPPGGEVALAAYQFDTRGSELSHLDGALLFRGPKAEASALRAGPRLAIVRLDGEREEKLRIAQPHAPRNAEGAHDFWGLDGRVIEKNRRVDLFQPVMWIKL